MKIKAIMFDLDGTLIDSAPDIQTCLEMAYTNTLDKPLTVNIRNHLGPRIFEIIKALSPDLDIESVNSIEQNFRTYYDNCGFKKTIPFKDAQYIINFLKQMGIEVFVVTNKPARPVQLIVDKYWSSAIKSFSPDSLSSEAVLSKPQIIAFIMKAYSYKSNEVLFVGDSANDIKAAHSEGVKAAAVTYGYGNKTALYESKPDFIIDDLLQLKTIINNWRGEDCEHDF